MGSFTDAITQFNPYVSQLPVEAMVKVGMQKQAQYEEGYKKIQGEIDRVAGLDIIKGVDKDYLQSKLDELGGNLRTFAAGDFSNFQLVNSVGGMARQVGKDENVQNAVASTAFVRNQRSLMDSERKKGTLHANNEIYYNDSLNAYLSSNKVGETFNTNYQPYTDYQKKWREVLKELDVKEDISDLPFLQDDKGRYIDAKGNLLPSGAKPIPNDYMIRETFKGKDPEKIKQAIMSTMDDNDYRQMRIDAYVQYKGYTPDMLADVAKTRFEKEQAPLLKTIDNLNILRSQNLGNQAMLDQIDKQLNQYKTKVDKDRIEFDEALQDINSNPESFKNKLFTMDSINQFANSFSNISHIQQIVDSPIKKQMNEDRQYNLSVMKFQVENDHWQKDYDIKVATEKRLADKDKFDQALEAYKAGAGPNPFLPEVGKLPGGAQTDEDVLNGLIESFKQGADLTQNAKDRNAIKAEWAKNQLTKADYEKQSGRKLGSMTDAEYRKILEDQFNSNLVAYNNNPNNPSLTVTERKAFDKYVRLDKIYKLKANLLTQTKNEVDEKHPEYVNEINKLSKNKIDFTDWRPSRFPSGKLNPRGETYTAFSKSEADIYNDIKNGDARLYIDKGQIALSYPKQNITYSTTTIGRGKGGEAVKVTLLNVASMYKKVGSLEKRRDQDYLVTLGNKINNIAPQYSNLPTGSASKFLPVLNKFKTEQKGQTEEAEGYVKGKDFDWNTSVALANDKETTPTYVTGLDRTYVTLVGKVNGKETTQSFVVPNTDFNSVFPGALGRNDIEFIQTSAANGSTNYRYPRLKSAVSDPDEAFSSANYTNYNTNKYIVKADVFFDQTDKNSTIPVIYVKSKKSGKVIPLAVNRDLTFSGSEATINQVTDASIIEQLKKQNINANF